MSLDVNFKIETNQDCGKLKFTDTTCEYNPLKPAHCCDGYGVDDNINKWEIGSTAFNWITPTGTVFTKRDLGFTPGVSAKASFEVTGGTDGVLIVCVGGKEVGKAIFVTDIDTTVEALVVDINSKSEQTGWKAIFVGSVITVINTSTDIEFNGLSLEVYVTDTMTVTINEALTAGGDDEDDSHYITMRALYGGLPCPTDQIKFESGIHTVVYIIYNGAGEEVARKTLKVFVDCEIINGLRKLTELLMANDCSCGNGTLAKRIMLLRARYDAICAMFSKKEYDCINEEVLDLLEDIKSACTDC
jgi:hypothetical protein